MSESFRRSAILIAAISRGSFRSKIWLSGGLLIFILNAALLGVWTVGHAIQLAPHQVVEKNLGDALGRGDVASISPNQYEGVTNFENALSRANVQHRVKLQTFDVKPDGYRDFTSYREGQWGEASWDRNHRIESGRWPVAPGEVVLSSSLSQELGAPSSITVLSGAVRLKVVGTSTFTYGRQASEILAAPGTWSTFNGLDPAEYPFLSAVVTVFWQGDVEDQVLTAATESFSDADTDTRYLFEQSRELAAALLVSPKKSALSGSPMMYSVPRSIVLCAAGSTMCLLAIGWVRRLSHAASLWGAPRHAVTNSGVAYGAILVTVLSLSGGIVGWLLAIAFRSTLSRLVYRPLSPVVLPHREILLCLVLTICGFVAASMVSSAVKLVADNAHKRWRHASRVIIHVALFISVIITVGSATRFIQTLFAAKIYGLENGPQSGLIALVGIGTLGAVALVKMIPSQSTHNMGVELSMRLIKKQLGRVATGISLMALVGAFPLAIASLNAVYLQIEKRSNISLIPMGQVQLQGGHEDLLPSRVEHIMAKTLAGKPDAEVNYLSLSDPEHVTGMGLEICVDSPEDIAIFVENESRSLAMQTMQSGGIVSSHERWEIVANPKLHLDQSTLSTVHVKFRPEWSRRLGAVLTCDTARNLGDTPEHFLTVWSDLSPEDEIMLKELPQKEGFQADMLYFHTEPNPPEIPIAARTAQYILCLVVTVISSALAWDSARRLKLLGDSLRAVGVPGRWLISVLLCNTMTTVLASMIIALTAGLIPTALLSAVVKDVSITLPGSAIAICCAGYIIGGAVAFAVISYQVKRKA